MATKWPFFPNTYYQLRVFLDPGAIMSFLLSTLLRMPTWSLKQRSQMNVKCCCVVLSLISLEIMQNCRRFSLPDATKWPNFRSLNYHLRVFYKIFALSLFTPEWTPCQATIEYPQGLQLCCVCLLVTQSSRVANWKRQIALLEGKVVRCYVKEKMMGLNTWPISRKLCAFTCQWHWPIALTMGVVGDKI